MSIIHDLKPEAIFADTVSLVDLLRISAVEWSETSGIPAEVRGETSAKTTADVRQELLRIVHEALSNVARHSEATRVTIDLFTLRNAGGALQLTIADNGHGFDPAVAPRGLGLYSMRDRAAELLGGRFNIVAGIGKGVAIHVTFLPEDVSRDA
jgi:two-component system sensor kinase